MNYLIEINNFNDWLVENPLNANVQALWYKLMSYANKFHWKREFSITNTRLVEDLGITRQCLDKCRNTLIQMGRIKYKKGSGNQCGIYEIIPFECNIFDTNVAQTWHNGGTNVAQTCPLNKYKYKQNIIYLNLIKKAQEKFDTAIFKNRVYAFNWCKEQPEFLELDANEQQALINDL